ncbi:MAG: hypothetical protein P4L84_32445 [Isosphaeraceae bacterium]|nr:hypothetical protein [Isosphaeraceae bacterium]
MNGGRVFGVALSDSIPWPWPAQAAEPVLAVCPIPIAALSMSPEAARELYRRAYEQALSAARPSRYELALTASRN